MRLDLSKERLDLSKAKQIEYQDKAQVAFKHALSIQTFNEKEGNYYYIGDWMYMGTGTENNRFKNRNTKKYIHINKRARWLIMFNISTTKVGGLRFIKIGKLCFCFCITQKYKALRGVE